MAAVHALHLGMGQLLQVVHAATTCWSNTPVRPNYEDDPSIEYWHKCNDKAFSQGHAIWCCSGEDIHITEIAMSRAVTSTRLFRKLLPVKDQARSRVSASMANYDCSLFASHSTRVCKSISSYFSEGLRKQQMNKNKVQKWGSELKRTSFLDPTIGSFWVLPFGSCGRWHSSAWGASARRQCEPHEMTGSIKTWSRSRLIAT